MIPRAVPLDQGCITARHCPSEQSYPKSNILAAQTAVGSRAQHHGMCHSRLSGSSQANPAAAPLHHCPANYFSMTRDNRGGRPVQLSFPPPVRAAAAVPRQRMQRRSVVVASEPGTDAHPAIRKVHACDSAMMHPFLSLQTYDSIRVGFALFRWPVVFPRHPPPPPGEGTGETEMKQSSGCRSPTKAQHCPNKVLYN
jgi:hypothetical protein